MRHLLKVIVRTIFQMERTIYCISGCRIELPLHRAYYRRCRKRFIKYRNDLALGKYVKC